MISFIFLIKTDATFSNVFFPGYNKVSGALHKLFDSYSLYHSVNPIAPRKTKIAYNFGLSECNRVKLNDRRSIA